MKKQILFSILLLSIVLIPNFSRAAIRTVLDGEGDEYVYIIVSADSLSDIKMNVEESDCDDAKCKKWTAILWDGINQKTIVYAGAVYNISDGLTQSMTFNVPSGAKYNILEIVGMNSNSDEVGRGKEKATVFINEKIAEEVLVETKEKDDITSISSDLKEGGVIITAPIDRIIIPEIPPVVPFPEPVKEPNPPPTPKETETPEKPALETNYTTPPITANTDTRGTITTTY